MLTWKSLSIFFIVLINHVDKKSSVSQIPRYFYYNFSCTWWVLFSYCDFVHNELLICANSTPHPTVPFPVLWNPCSCILLCALEKQLSLQTVIFDILFFDSANLSSWSLKKGSIGLIFHRRYKAICICACQPKLILKAIARRL